MRTGRKILQGELNMNVEGEVDGRLITELEKAVKPIAERVSEAVYRKMEEKRLERQAIQEGLA